MYCTSHSGHTERRQRGSARPRQCLLEKGGSHLETKAGQPPLLLYVRKVRITQGLTQNFIVIRTLGSIDRG